jgi:hypothetical protein
MIEAAFIFLILFFSIFSEIVFGSFGFVVPVSACAIFYISVNYGWKLSIILGLLVGLVVDVLFGRHGLHTPYLLFIIAIMGTYWLHKGILKIIRLQVIPGVIIGIVYTAPQMFFCYYTYDSGFMLFLFKLLSLTFTVIITATLLPFMILLFDSFSEKLGIPVYIKAKKRLYESN